MWTELNKIWKDNDITITTKCRIVNALVFPVVLYGCESWTIRKTERKRIDSSEMWCLRRLLRISWTARRTSKSVIEEIKVTNPLEVLIQKHSLTHSLIWRPSRVANTPPLLPISRYGYCLFVADVCLCSEVLQPGGSRSSSGSGSM